MKVNQNFPARRKGEREAADTATTLLADYIAQHQIKRSVLVRGTGLSEGILRRSLSTRTRSLRADEFLAVCRFLGKEPFDFAEDCRSPPPPRPPRRSPGLGEGECNQQGREVNTMLTPHISKLDGRPSRKPYNDEVNAVMDELEAVLSRHNCSYPEARKVLLSLADRLATESNEILDVSSIQTFRTFTSSQTNSAD